MSLLFFIYLLNLKMQELLHAITKLIQYIDFMIIFAITCLLTDLKDDIHMPAYVRLDP